MVDDLIIWHNPRCSKSRQTLALLQERGLQPRVVHYLDTPPDAARLAWVLERLGFSPRELMRRREAPYVTLQLAPQETTDAALIAAMVAHPILIERPIVIAGDRVALGRPPEAVLDLLD